MFLAQYEVLRERGHSPSEAFNETVEEATQSLYPLIGGVSLPICLTKPKRKILTIYYVTEWYGLDVRCMLYHCPSWRHRLDQ